MDSLYKFMVLAFGNRMAVYVINKVQHKIFFWGLAIDTGSFIDDGLIVN